MPSFLPSLKASTIDPTVQQQLVTLQEKYLLVAIIAALACLLITFAIVSRKKKQRIEVQKPTTSDRDKLLIATQQQDALTELQPKPQEVIEIISQTKATWLGRLKEGLARSHKQLAEGLTAVLAKKQVFDEELLDQIHEILYKSDIGADTTDFLVSQLRKNFTGKANPTWTEVCSVLSKAVAEVLASMDQSTSGEEPIQPPEVILIVGVNGVGKTTSIGKLAAHFVSEQKSVMLCAADTYRAAAIEQLQVWGHRLNVPVIAHQQGSDPASVAFDAIKSARARGIDVLMIDTAGRLHNKQELMDELAKIRRVINKEYPGSPHETLLVIDATTGQNAFQQVQAFRQIVDLTGLVVTKLDGTAKGGVIIGLIKKFGIPVRYIGVGEKASDLRKFNPEDFASTLFPH